MFFSCSKLLLYATLLVFLQTGNTVPANFTSNFEKSCSYTIPPLGIEIESFVSKRTGISIFFLKTDGPMVNGFMSFGTEPKSNDGIPHTLEHLIFLGSEDYPYNGILDLLASKGLAAGTNAMTNRDSTTYTVETAGSEGFLNILPIYLDHILYPTLTNSSFITEVYHITGSGEDAGVVYSELQGFLNSASSLANEAMMAELFPPPSPYSYSGAGDLESTRDSLTIEKIRAYHKAYYRPENLQLIVTGQVDVERVMSVLQEYEEKIISKGDRSPYSKPWQSPNPSPTQTIRKDILYPSHEEKSGMVKIAFRGRAEEHFEKSFSIEVLLNFLTSFTASHLRNVFIEGNDSLAVSLSSSTTDGADQSYTVDISGVPLEKFDMVEFLFNSTLQEMIHETSKFPISDIKDHINQMILKTINTIENNPINSLPTPIVKFGLYATECDEFGEYVDNVSWFEILYQKTGKFWQDLIRESILEVPKVIVRASPSKAEAERIANETKMRIQERKEKLGEEGLKLIEEEVAAAKKINEIPPPPSMINEMVIPSVNGVTFHPLKSYSNIQSVNNHSVTFNSNSSYFDLANLSFKLTLDDVNSNFVYLSAVMDTSSLNVSEKLYLPLIMELLFETDILRNGSIHMPYMDLMRETSQTFVVRDSHLNMMYQPQFICNYFCNYALITAKTDRKHYERGVLLLYDIMYNTKFTVSRVKAKISRMLNTISQYKLNAFPVLDYLKNTLIYDDDSNFNLISFVKQEGFLTEILKRLEREEDAQEIINDLTLVLASLTEIENVSFNMAANARKLAQVANINGPWDIFENRTLVRNLKLNISPDSDSKKTVDRSCLLSSKISQIDSSANEIVPVIQNINSSGNIIRNCTPTAYLKGVSSLKSSNVDLLIDSISDFHHEDLAALQVTLQYFDQTSGPLWNAIRGNGFAYSSRIVLSPDKGLLTLSISRASQPAEAYEAAINVLNGYLNSSIEWEASLVDTARSSLLYSAIGDKETLTSTVQHSIKSYYNGTYSDDFLHELSVVTMDDIKEAFQTYVTPLLSPETSTTIIVSPSIDLQKIETTLSRLGHRVKVVDELEKKI